MLVVYEKDFESVARDLYSLSLLSDFWSVIKTISIISIEIRSNACKHGMENLESIPFMDLFSILQENYIKYFVLKRQGF